MYFTLNNKATNPAPLKSLKWPLRPPFTNRKARNTTPSLWWCLRRLTTPAPQAALHRSHPRPKASGTPCQRRRHHQCCNEHHQPHQWAGCTDQGIAMRYCTPKSARTRSSDTPTPWKRASVRPKADTCENSASKVVLGPNSLPNSVNILSNPTRR